MPIEIPKRELEKVIVEFKRKAYAGEGEYKPVPLLGIIKRFEDRMRNWFFSDEYSGDACFAGIERLSCLLARDAITERGSFKIGEMKEIWQMPYRGRVLSKTVSKRTIYDFLRKPLQAVPIDLPFRGPIGKVSNKDFPGFEYHNELIAGNDVSNATGIEKIFFNGEEVYEGFWSGGLSMKNLGDIVLI